MDVEMLSRLQFAGTIMFHYLFPPLTIGLGIVIVYLLGMHLRTKDLVYREAGRFWVRIFGLNFAMGVVTGIVMEFQFGTNWAAYSRFVGDIFGAALAAEGIFAFFLESGFLAVLLFGWDRVGPRMHFFSALMVALGSMFSAVWIVVANSWQQTPAGYKIVEVTNDAGFTELQCELVDFWAAVLNPSTIDRLSHVLIGAFVVGGFFVMSVSAYYLLKRRHEGFARHSFRGGLYLGAVAAILALVTGHDQALQVAETQPAKMAAYEGHFTTDPNHPGADLYLFGWPDESSGEVKFGLAVPGMLSWLIHGDFSTPVPALDEFPQDEIPPVWIPFQTYHIMITVGFAFIGLTLVTLPLMFTGKLWNMRWLLWVFVLAVVPAYIANHAGWVAAEVGRQPWVVYPSVSPAGEPLDGLRTADALSESVEASEVLWSITMFGSIYALLLALFLYLLNSKIQHGPEGPASEMKPGGKEEGFLAAGALRADPGGAAMAGNVDEPRYSKETLERADTSGGDH